jgi:DNA-binding response OmpR family regulator
VSRILIVGKDWQSRALLRAQLLEEGFDVEAHETISDALMTFGDSNRPTNLMIVDVSSGDEPSSSLDVLSTWSRKVPIWIIASQTFIVDKGLRGHGFEMIMLRPVDLGELVDQIKQRLDEDMEVKG